jgi:hypothetical protein
MLSAIPVISAGNCCCCLWVIVGGVIAAYILSKSDGMAGDGDGALVGLGSGLVAALMGDIFLILQFLFVGSQSYIDMINAQSVNMPPETQQFMQQMIQAVQNAGPMLLLFIAALFFIFNLVIYGAVGALGGLIGMQIFRPTPPPQPPLYGGYPPPGTPGAPLGYGPPGYPPPPSYPPAGQQPYPPAAPAPYFPPTPAAPPGGFFEPPAAPAEPPRNWGPPSSAEPKGGGSGGEGTGGGNDPFRPPGSGG